MDITFRALVTAVHGMLFGAFFLLAAYALILHLVREGYEEIPHRLTTKGFARERLYLAFAAVSGWIAVLSGTYLVYPWYRAPSSPGSADLHQHAKALLLSSPSTAGLHTLGMEWKEHVAFLAPIAFTMVAYVYSRYRGQIAREKEIRRAVLSFALVALVAAGIAGFFGAFLNKYAPTEGGRVLHIATSQHP